MPEKYILGIDQSTSGTKALLFDDKGKLLSRFDLHHRQIIDKNGWIEHDPMEIYRNTIGAVRGLVERVQIESKDILGIGISNQRETAMIWDRDTGKPVYNAIVWQCVRGEAICKKIAGAGATGEIKEETGLQLSPYFSAAKLAWVLENITGLKGTKLCCGTMDSWLVYKLTGNFKTDYSNASRTQLYDINQLCWSNKLCNIFNISINTLPEVCDSNSLFGETKMENIFDKPIPIFGVIGDSQGALFGQGGIKRGSLKTTYGTGSSVMMNIGDKPVKSMHLVTSIAWGISGKIDYVMEGNINYTGAVIKWLVDDLGLIASSKDAGKIAAEGKRVEGLYFVPAFSGLGAPYWDGEARAVICGLDRGCGRAEIVRAAEESIAYQITNILRLMKEESRLDTEKLMVDGGPTRDEFLMQFQADIGDIEVVVPDIEELSGTGAAYLAGCALGLYDDSKVFNHPIIKNHIPIMEAEERDRLLNGWHLAVKKSFSKGNNQV
jgi:glycerol kinase